MKPNRIILLIFLLIFYISYCIPDVYAQKVKPQKEDNKGKELRLSDGRWEIPRWSLKTNGLLWVGATIPNITCEFRPHSHIAVDLGLWWCPWKLSDKYSLKIAAILPEARWYLSEEDKGHFFDLHLSCAWYNLRWKDNRYQDAHFPLLGAGIGYGFRFRFNENWGMELGLGLGYLNMKYDTYYNIENGAYIDTRRTSYFGIDRASVSIVYSFSR